MSAGSPHHSVSELLEVALGHHQEGRLDEAEAGYLEVLSQAPDNSDASNLLGVLAHQRGEHRRAIELIQSAIDNAPDEAHFYTNLAEAYRALGQIDDAIANCRRSLALQPSSAEAANNLGLALQTRGELDDALGQFETALRLKPDFAQTLNNMGNVRREQGRLEDAARLFRRATILCPDLAEAHTNLGQLLVELGRADEAIVYCREAVRLAPHLAPTLVNLGNALRKLGRLDDAKQRYAQAIELDPNLAMAYNNFGQALEEERLTAEATEWFEQACQRDPDSAHIRTSLARIASEDQDFPEAIARFERVIQRWPQYAQAHDGLGAALYEQGRLEESRSALQEAIRLEPTYASAHCNLGYCLGQLGRTAEAVDCFRQALRCDPLFTRAYVGLATTLVGQLPDDDIVTIQHLIDQRQTSPRKSADLQFALANVFHARGDFASASSHAQTANATRHRLNVHQAGNIDDEQHVQFVDGLIDAFQPEFFQRVRDWGVYDEVAVFHVGLPRSGKTLAENLLAAHPDVHGAGEQRLGRESFEAFPEWLGLSGRAIDCISQWTREAVEQIAERHLERLVSLAPQARRIVDTMPSNYLFLGVIQALMPRARIVHCRRDLADTALSCWLKNFNHLNWAFSLDHLAVRIREYQRLMNHWREVLPLPILEIDYEQMVSDPESASRQLVEFAGLEWHPDCLASLEQQETRAFAPWSNAHPPYNTQLVGGWRHYQSLLAPLLDELPVDWSEWSESRTGEPP